MASSFSSAACLRDVAKNYVAFNLLAILSRDDLRSEQPLADNSPLLGEFAHQAKLYRGIAISNVCYTDFALNAAVVLCGPSGAELI